MRERLANPGLGLGTPLESSIDPITVVARGIALLAPTYMSEPGAVPAETSTMCGKLEEAQMNPHLPEPEKDHTLNSNQEPSSPELPNSPQMTSTTSTDDSEVPPELRNAHPYVLQEWFDFQGHLKRFRLKYPERFDGGAEVPDVDLPPND